MSDVSSLIKVSPKRMASAIVRHAKSKNPAFFWGHPGVSKSAVVQQVARAIGYHLEDIRLSQISSIDLRGIPSKEQKVKLVDVYDSNGQLVIDEETGKPKQEEVMETNVVWAMPDFLKRARDAWEKEGKPTLFFFDELNSGGSEVMKAAYQFIFDRKIGPFTLGPRDFVLAAGNFASDGANVAEMPIPLLNRFVHYHTVINAKDWCEWAIKANIHPWVVSYIDAHPQSLHFFSENAKNAVQKIQSQEEKSFHSPRTWEFLSNDLHALLETDFDKTDKVTFIDEELQIDSFSEEDLLLVASTTVGSSQGIAFKEFVEKGKDLPKAEDILLGKAENNPKLKANISGMYMLSNSICYLLNKEKEKWTIERNDKVKSELKETYELHIKNFINYAKENFNDDMFTVSTVEKMTRQLRIIAKIGTPESKLVLDAFKKIQQIDKALES